ncbi:hypothetical protein [Haloferula sp. BvORR071]|uniref:hypothetical protein n=1 Tax=Haloferula sp. BvORR071 TaxID=1396141 RepID=UPI0005566E02|nr:hypothetical protein [Haloferula sp. BvORR071]
MKRDLHQLAEEVHDEESFIGFLRALADDRAVEEAGEPPHPVDPCGRGANGWENHTISSFLFAAEGWAVGSKHGLPLYTPPENPWARCAEILLMGKLYE